MLVDEALPVIDVGSPLILTVSKLVDEVGMLELTISPPVEKVEVMLDLTLSLPVDTVFVVL